MSDLKEITEKAQQAIEDAADSAGLDLVRVAYLGKKGELTGLLKSLGKLPAEERPAAGAQINIAKGTVQDAINIKKALFDQAAIEEQLRDRKSVV